jgi:hypothetical protein
MVTSWGRNHRNQPVRQNRGSIAAESIQPPPNLGYNARSLRRIAQARLGARDLARETRRLAYGEGELAIGLELARWEIGPQGEGVRGRRENEDQAVVEIGRGRVRMLWVRKMESLGAGARAAQKSEFGPRRTGARPHGKSSNGGRGGRGCRENNHALDSGRPFEGRKMLRLEDGRRIENGRKESSRFAAACVGPKASRTVTRAGLQSA